MARPKNQNNIDSIVAAARRLFRSKGYADTSYSDLSAESGVGRPAVQNYFPKKRNLAIEQLQRLREVSAEMGVQAFPDRDHLLAQHYTLGQIYLTALLSCGEARRFICDILHDRDLIKDEIESDLAWSLGMLGVPQIDHQSEREELFQNAVAAMGGIYELMYYSASTGVAIDVPKRLMVGMRNLAVLMEIPQEECEAILSKCAIEQSLLEDLGSKAFDKAFS